MNQNTNIRSELTLSQLNIYAHSAAINSTQEDELLCGTQSYWLYEA